MVPPFPPTLRVSLYARRTARAEKGGWSPMSDTYVRDFTRYSGVIRPINAGRPAEMRTMLRGRPYGRHETIHRCGCRVIPALMRTLIIIKIDIRGDAVTGLARCHIIV